MRHAFTAKQIPALLGLSPAECEALIAEVFPLPRDLFNAQDIVALKRAKQQQARQLSLGLMLAHVQSGARNAESLFATGVQLEEQHPAQAVDAYTEAVAANPRYADAHVNLGRLLHQQRRLPEAEAHYVAALVSRPNDVTAMFNLAVVLEDEGRADEAIARYREAIELDPHCVDAYFNLARLFERKGEKMAAIRHLKDYRRLTRDR